MSCEDFRVIPGYPQYLVSNCGKIKSTFTGKYVKQYLLNGYKIVDCFGDSLTETLPVHRAVALAWVKNTHPTKFKVVNHIDGDPLNNVYVNLEWTDFSGNNYHAVNNGLRKDNIPCKVRKFETGEVIAFSSMAQAAEYMGLPKCTSYRSLKHKKFGKLIRGSYEFRFSDDETPWFYGDGKPRIKPTRYMVEVICDDSPVLEIYSMKKLLALFKLYDAPGRSFPVVVGYANSVYSDKLFVLRDAVLEQGHRVLRKTNKSFRMFVSARNSDRLMKFDSLSQCAAYFNVDRSSIQSRIVNGRSLDGWTFTTDLPS
jgi:hypothetical protein